MRIPFNGECSDLITTNWRPKPRTQWLRQRAARPRLRQKNAVRADEAASKPPMLIVSIRYNRRCRILAGSSCWQRRLLAKAWQSLISSVCVREVNRPCFPLMAGRGKAAVARICSASPLARRIVNRAHHEQHSQASRTALFLLQLPSPTVQSALIGRQQERGPEIPDYRHSEGYRVDGGARRDRIHHACHIGAREAGRA